MNKGTAIKSNHSHPFLVALDECYHGNNNMVQTKPIIITKIWVQS